MKSLNLQKELSFTWNIIVPGPESRHRWQKWPWNIGQRMEEAPVDNLGRKIERSTPDSEQMPPVGDDATHDLCVDAVDEGHRAGNQRLVDGRMEEVANWQKGMGSKAGRSCCLSLRAGTSNQTNAGLIASLAAPILGTPGSYSSTRRPGFMRMRSPAAEEFILSVRTLSGLSSFVKIAMILGSSPTMSSREPASS
jgi:hypothetical protein